MPWPFKHKATARYWLKVFAWYALAEAVVQLIFMLILNNFGNRRISIPEFHLIMWFFQCALIWPVWWVAKAVLKQHIALQLLVNISFYVVYTYCWFGPVQQSILFLYNGLQQVTRPASDRQLAMLDDGTKYSYLTYQLLKHTFRLSWFYLASYFLNYKQEEQKKIELAVHNKALQLKLHTWHLNPSFYFKTISNLQQMAARQPSLAAAPILQLAKVMEYVIYDARQPKIEVKKEIDFLRNYINLVNQQPDNKVPVTLAYSGQYENLTIAPLLLAGLVDNISAVAGSSNQQLIAINFSNSHMEVYVKEVTAQPVTPLLIEGLYAQQYMVKYEADKGYNLQMKLDVEG